jgi:hypothetical protein
MCNSRTGTVVIINKWYTSIDVDGMLREWTIQQALYMQRQPVNMTKEKSTEYRIQKWHSKVV